MSASAPETPLSIESSIRLSSGYNMPLLGLGVFRNTGSTVVPACLTAFETGYRHIDSAKLYNNEKEVGQAVAKSGLKREEIFVTTKIRSVDHARVRPQLMHSLNEFRANDSKTFQFGAIDLLLIHDPQCGPQNRPKMWREFLKARDEGVVKSIGVSNYGTRHLQEILDAGLELPVLNQIELHPFCQQKEIAKWCQNNGVVIQAYCPLVRGQRWDDPTLKAIAELHGKNAGQILVRWSLQKGYSPLPKSSQTTRVKSNADLYDFVLNDDEMAALDKLDEGDRGALSWNPIHAR